MAGYVKEFANKIHCPDSLNRKENSGTVLFTVTIDTLGNVSGFECLRSPHQVFCEEVGTKTLLTNGRWTPMVINDRRHPYTVTSYAKFHLACR